MTKTLASRSSKLLAGLSVAIIVGLAGLTQALVQDVTPSDRVTRNLVVRLHPTTASPAIGRLLPGEMGGWKPKNRAGSVFDRVKLQALVADIERECKETEQRRPTMMPKK